MSRKIWFLTFLFLLLIPLFCFSQNIKKTPKVSFDYIDADVRNVIRSLSEVSGKNIIISEAVKGKVTMKLEDVYWDEALDVIISTSALKKIETDNIIKVMTAKEFDDDRKSRDTERDAFRKERLEKQRMGEEFVTETVYLNYANPTDVEKMLRSGSTGAAGAGGTRGFLSEFGSITQVPWDNAIIIRDTKENIESIRKIIREHDTKPSQIQIDCKIVQATSSFSKELGIQWGARYNDRSGIIGNKEFELTGGRNIQSFTEGGTGTYKGTVGKEGFRPGGLSIPYNVNLPAAVGQGSGGILGLFIGSAEDSNLLDIQLSALEDEGRGRVLSNPKVVTSDNKKAIIQQGKSIPYKTVSTTGTQTQFAEAVLGLEVTPTVTKDGYIKLEILAKKDQADFINQSEGVPTIDKKQATTLLYVRDGETAVIGGIYERSENEGESGLPGLKNIPLFGWLFKKQSKSDDKTELLIFITPRILKNLYKDEG
jgi:type IV pilus assembly protein PilQ